MKRALLVSALLVGAGGCKKSEPPPPAELVRTSPGTLLDSYAETGNELEVTGLVKDIRDTGGLLSVFFESNHPEHSVVCQADATQSVAVGQLVKGQLVAMHGLARGRQGDNPALEKCRVTWAGPSPRTDPAGDREALRAARSLDVCMVPLLVDELRRRGEKQPDGKPLTEAAFREADADRSKRLDTAEKSARAELAAAGLTSLSCDHPLVHLLKRCEVGSEKDKAGVECTSRYVSEIRALLPH